MMAGRGDAGGRARTDGTTRHIPVLLAEVLERMAPVEGATIIDGTFGAGGYTRALLAGGAARVLAIDRDPTAIAGGADLALEFPDRLILASGRFGELDVIARDNGIERADAVVLDIGVSSMQLDSAGRGFSFQADGPLDMRMEAEGPSAADVVNGVDEADLADILFQLGEERQSRRVARAICRAREKGPIASTRALADIVARAIPRSRDDERHPATRSFQALRIFVNDELGELADGLAAAERILVDGGRLVVVTFHSLEDRIVKRTLAAAAGRLAGGSRHAPPMAAAPLAPRFHIVNQRPLTPSGEEIASNPRARSARLRAALRTAAPAAPAPDDVSVGVIRPWSLTRRA